MMPAECTPASADSGPTVTARLYAGAVEASPITALPNAVMAFRRRPFSRGSPVTAPAVAVISAATPVLRVLIEGCRDIVQCRGTADGFRCARPNPKGYVRARSEASAVGVLGRRIGAAHDLVGEPAGGVDEDSAHVGVPLDELRRGAGR